MTTSTVDVVVSVPASDATPMTLLEAVASGTPVVAGALPSIREWREAIDPALLIDHPTSRSISDAIRRALAFEAATLRTLQQRGRDAVLARAERRTNMLEMQQLYRGLVRRRVAWSTTSTAG